MKNIFSITKTFVLYKKYLFFFFLFTFFTACNDNILDLQPLDSFGEEGVFNDVASVNLYVNGTYQRIGHGFEADYAINESMTDNSYGYSSTSLHNAYVRAEGNRDNGETMTRDLWANSYNVFRRVNLFIEKSANSTIAPATLNKLKAEMQFIRAFKYAELLITYGGVPIITDAYKLDSPTFEVTRNSIDEVVDFIVKECDAIIPVLPNFASTEKGRASKEAAMALKARTLLYAASPLLNPSNTTSKWTAASVANKAVMDLPGFAIINNGTAADYYNTFTGQNQSEIIFARYFTPNNTQKGGNGANSIFYPNGFDSSGPQQPTLDVISAYEMSNGKLPEEAGSGYDPQNPYINREPRFYANFLYNGALFYDPYSAKAVRPLEYWLDKANPTNKNLNGRESRGAVFYADGSSFTTHNFKKFTVEGLGVVNVGANAQVNPWIYYRKSEFYLNYAECQIALGNEAEARSAINRIRQKTGLLPITESGAELVKRYRRERRVELMLENHRLADIRRWKIGPEALNNKPVTTVDIARDAATNIMTYTYGRIVDANRKWDDKMYWFPIPYSEIQRSNNKLTQNPGYN